MAGKVSVNITERNTTARNAEVRGYASTREESIYVKNVEGVVSVFTVNITLGA